MSINDIEIKIKDLKELETMADQLNAEIESIKDELKKELETRQTDEITTNLFKIKWKAVKNSRFDSTTLKKEMPEIYNQFLKTTETKRFTIN